MARQSGLVRLKGTIGGITFYRSGGEYLAREKGGIDPERLKNDPAFERTRENGEEFGRAGANGKVLRNAIRMLLLKAADKRMVSRLTRDILKVIKTDPVNSRGKRMLIEGDMDLLKGFDFNIRGKFSSTFYEGYSVILDRAAGEVDIEIPAMIPANGIAAPTGATHVKFIAGAAAIDFEGNVFNSDVTSSADVIIGPSSVGPFTLSMTLPAASSWPIVVVFGLEFSQEVNGNLYPLKNGAFNALSIVEVDKV